MNGTSTAHSQQPGHLRVAWDAWLELAHRAGKYQALAVLSFVYFCVLGPTVLIARLFGVRLLDLDFRPRASYWRERQPMERSLEALTRQF